MATKKRNGSVPERVSEAAKLLATESSKLPGYEGWSQIQTPFGSVMMRTERLSSPAWGAVLFSERLARLKQERDSRAKSSAALKKTQEKNRARALERQFDNAELINAIRRLPPTFSRDHAKARLRDYGIPVPKRFAAFCDEHGLLPCKPRGVHAKKRK